MESMGEFDSECPMVKRFCQQMSEDDFEREGLTYTQQALQDLFAAMEQRPELCERVVRRRKQKELERGAVGTSMKAKFFCAVEGQMNRCNTVGAEELQDRVGQLRAEMERVQAYAQEAKCATKRSSQRLADKRRLPLDRAAGQGTPTPSLCPGVPPVPPPLPPPPPPATPLRENAKIQQVAATPDLLTSYGLSRLNRPISTVELCSPLPGDSKPRLDIQTELLAYNPAQRLKATGIARSPGGTPTLRAPIRDQRRSPMSAFNTALLSKFQNAQSPPQDASVPEAQPSSDSEGDGFVTPPDSP
ncbi:mitochondrial fission regulator 2-like [Brienomyrus brachyistius]|uniref:mitochondrial fission regulator 2-like n=1 Tax=Brienomyrus brachyistius TaxID=42636 RepID=UPI0020B41FA5|nr:mitochondrial fission regulator 2-like [Brienomyrus brachyistius]XP_048835976.1 mitochondrial fission regulator 2-like [Brienomyrus brachyistius]XP_048835977.1 mitochondrial fission regulator 2-like [Brienomyrus brachyistius]